MFEDHNSTILEIVAASNLISKEQLDEINETHLKTGVSLADAIISSGLISKGQLLKAIADSLGYEYMPTLPNEISPELARQLRPPVARMYPDFRY